jgi:phosphoglycerate dehydrogenase-like enzyme
VTGRADSGSRVVVTSRSFSKNTVLRKELLDRYSNVTFNDAGLSLSNDALVKFLRGHDKAIVALEKITDDVLARLPELKVISKYGVGIDNIDVEALKRRGVQLGWTGGVNRRSVSELVIATTIGLLRHVYVSNMEVRQGTWRQHTGSLLSGKTVGIVGLGHVGKDLVGMLAPFDCRVLAHDIVEFRDFCVGHGITQMSLDQVLRESDIVTIHLPLDDSTRGMFSSQALRRMKKDALLINIARGGIVDESALKEALQSGHLRGAAFDVFSDEPPHDAELLNLPNFLATPHIGGSSMEAILAMGRAAIAGLQSV